MDSLKVFISFSGKPSLKVAEALRDWLPAVLQRVKPFVSQADIGAGVRWAQHISKELADTSFGILCLTPDNIDNRWILFEAGALTKLPEGRAVPYLLNLSFSSVQAPLSQFQMKVADKEGTWELVKSINAVFEQDALAQATLEMLFEQMWPRLEAKLAAAAKEGPTRPRPDQSAMLEELLSMSRTQMKLAELSHGLLEKSFTRLFENWFLRRMGDRGEIPPSLQQRAFEMAEQVRSGQPMTVNLERLMSRKRPIDDEE